MGIQDLLLTKEEIPIIQDTLFKIPIHPMLIDNKISLDPSLANRVFPQAAQEWYDDLKQHTMSLEKGSMRDWYERVFLGSGLSFSSTKGSQVVGVGGGWRDNVQTLPNGFASTLSIDRNAGGSLFLEVRPEYVCPPFVRFSKEKCTEYDAKVFEMKGRNGMMANVYGQHNVDYFPGALFLRNWALLYLNAAMEAVIESFLEKTG